MFVAPVRVLLFPLSRFRANSPLDSYVVALKLPAYFISFLVFLLFLYIFLAVQFFFLLCFPFFLLPSTCTSFVFWTLVPVSPPTSSLVWLVDRWFSSLKKKTPVVYANTISTIKMVVKKANFYGFEKQVRQHATHGSWWPVIYLSRAYCIYLSICLSILSIDLSITHGHISNNLSNGIYDGIYSIILQQCFLFWSTTMTSYSNAECSFELSAALFMTHLHPPSPLNEEIGSGRCFLFSWIAKWRHLQTRMITLLGALNSTYPQSYVPPSVLLFPCPIIWVIFIYY